MGRGLVKAFLETTGRGAAFLSTEFLATGSTFSTSPASSGFLVYCAEYGPRFPPPKS